ncbi:MAG TPA: hypothetical protein VGD79_13850 [Thermoanaerobaculia bacterium]
MTDVADEGLRSALRDLLMLVDIDVLWPRYSLARVPAVLLDSRDAQHPLAYCIGDCEPRTATAKTPRLWRATLSKPVPPGTAVFGPVSQWHLPGEGEVTAVSFQRREQAVTVLLHEYFHVQYQAEYAQSFGDELRGESRGASTATRADLETSYSTREPVRGELRKECSALADALRAGKRDRATAISALHRFAAARELRRARPDAPVFEEDFWERLEGVPVNLERRAAAHFGFPDPSLIGAAVNGSGCELIPDASYVLMLGGLQGAVLDELGDASAWPNRVYPTDGTPAVALYRLILELSSESERGDT